MKIAISMPFGWPYLRRGNRISYELAVYMASRGHEVHYITTKPGPKSRYKKKNGLLVRYYPVMENQLLKMLDIDYWQTFGISCMSPFFREDFDVVLTTVTADGFAASLNRRRYGTPFIHYTHNGNPVYRDFRRGKILFRQIVQTASRMIVPSSYVTHSLKKQFGRNGIVLHCPVDTEKFYPLERKDNSIPKILCTASMAMGRKRIPLLVKAFEKLVDRLPHAILQLGGDSTPKVTRDLLMSVNARTRKAIQILNISSDEVLAAFYRNATITVLPSLNEPFGMVTTESLASGTPVVGTRSGGIPEILNSERIGVLFEASDGADELSKALMKGIELAGDPGTGKYCRERADRLSWKVLGPKYEALYMEVVDEDKTRAKRYKKNKKNRKPLKDEELPHRYSPKDLLNTERLSAFFINILDSLDMTETDYYRIYSEQPKYLYILHWILSRGAGRNILVLSSYSNFLTHLCERMGFFVTECMLRNSADLSKISGDEKIFSLRELQFNSKELFDIVVCDDVLQYLSGIGETMKYLEKRLKPEGLLLITTRNATRVSNRLALLAGKNIYPETWKVHSQNGFYRTKEGRWSFLYREYTLREVTEIVSRTHLRIMEGTCFRGEKPIYKTVSFASVPFKTVLLQELNKGLQKMIKSLGSHIFVAARRQNGENLSE